MTVKKSQIDHRISESRIFLIGLLAVLMMFVSMTFGRYSLSFKEIILTIINGISGHVADVNAHNVIFNIRLPRVLLALIAGAGLAVAGGSFQALFSNPLATPDTLGVASGASFGAVLALLLGFNLPGVQMLAMAFGFLSILIVYLIARFNQSKSIVMVVLAGMVVSSLFQAAISFVKLTADTQDQLPAITFWLMGGLSGTTFTNLGLSAPLILLGLAILLLLRWRLNAISLNADEAKTLGLNVKLIQALVIFASTMITAAVVSACGQIGWVGLLIPHIARMLFGNDNRLVIPASTALGSLFFIAIDTIARAAFPSEIPVSILTALFGAPFFIILLRKTGGVR